jgi:hypothetical protein
VLKTLRELSFLLFATHYCILMIAIIIKLRLFYFTIPFCKTALNLQIFIIYYSLNIGWHGEMHSVVMGLGCFFFFFFFFFFFIQPIIRVDTTCIQRPSLYHTI